LANGFSANARAKPRCVYMISTMDQDNPLIAKLRWRGQPESLNPTSLIHKDTTARYPLSFLYHISHFCSQVACARKVLKRFIGYRIVNVCSISISLESHDHPPKADVLSSRVVQNVRSIPCRHYALPRCQ
jgi:hypothetical protein